MTNDFDTRVRDYLAQGLGVEDIALMMDTAPELVRGAVQRLRNKGVLAKMWKGSAKE